MRKEKSVWFKDGRCLSIALVGALINTLFLTDVYSQDVEFRPVINMDVDNCGGWECANVGDLCGGDTDGANGLVFACDINLRWVELPTVVFQNNFWFAGIWPDNGETALSRSGFTNDCPGWLEHDEHGVYECNNFAIPYRNSFGRAPTSVQQVWTGEGSASTAEAKWRTGRFAPGVYGTVGNCIPYYSANEDHNCEPKFSFIPGWLLGGSDYGMICRGEDIGYSARATSYVCGHSRERPLDVGARDANWKALPKVVYARDWAYAKAWAMNAQAAKCKSFGHTGNWIEMGYNMGNTNCREALQYVFGNEYYSENLDLLPDRPWYLDKGCHAMGDNGGVNFIEGALYGAPTEGPGACGSHEWNTWVDRTRTLPHNQGLGWWWVNESDHRYFNVED